MMQHHLPISFPLCDLTVQVRDFSAYNGKMVTIDLSQKLFYTCKMTSTLAYILFRFSCRAPLE